ncbi:MAG TPA: DNA polymerase III subunit gamma/tau [Acidimicrobiales bacterium]|nr:DNA polymerase III subunit gamma/tau [Acidimicrobiales bacterium]
MADDEANGAAQGPYQSLYRRFRPQRFSELRGQEHVALALRNAVRDERVSHAYLFSGPRGTGKTSTARILAKALNCTVASDGEPCGTCDSCRSITEGSSFDVHELDAASNNGVDAMRDLVARAALATPGRWKVYIVDEVHMLSVAASNALLKTLEEPPGHVVFVLATTDPHKVLPTIRSRTQHFEFHLLGEEILAGLLEDVAREAALELPSGALATAVRRGRGSARDALSVLDQVAAAGVVDNETGALTQVITAIGEFDSEGALVALDRAVRAGHDPQQLASELIEQLRAGFLSLASGGSLPDGATTLPADELEAVHQLGLVRSVRALEVIGTAIVAMRESPEPRITLEVAIIRLAHPEADSSPEAIVERLERLERRLEAIVGSALAPPPAPPPTPSSAPAAAPPAPPPAVAPPSSGVPAATFPSPPAPPEHPAASAPAAGPAAAADAPAAPRPRPALGAFRSEQAAAAPPAAAAPSAPPPPPAAEPVVAPAAARPMPSRDELVLAWGDHVLQGLRAKVRAVFGIAHFVGTEGTTALLAVPNAAHLAHAEPLVGEVAVALSSHFGTPVAVRLVTEGFRETPSALADDDGDPFPDKPPSAAPATPARPPAREHTPPPEAPRPAIDREDSERLDEVGDVVEEGDGAAGNLGVALATDRILQAFPGAEEVERG